MKKRQKQLLLSFFVILAFLGLILAACSSIYVIIEEESIIENGIKYSISRSEMQIKNGTKIIRYFKAGEKMTIRFTHNFKPPYPDILPPINFTILSPKNKTTILWFWLEPKSNPFDPYAAPQIVVTNLTIYKIEDLKPVSTNLKFIAETLENGNYTLIFTSEYADLNYLAFVKILSFKEYPYTYMLPLGIALTCIGVISSIWITRIKRRRKIKRVS
ncbi:MAG: hypothetical protein ACTSX6_03520 [Candidatus Heimdallarchaeaceae archaeon]